MSLQLNRQLTADSPHTPPPSRPAPTLRHTAAVGGRFMAFAFHKSQAFQVLMGFHISICQAATAALCVRAGDTAGGSRSTMGGGGDGREIKTFASGLSCFHWDLWRKERQTRLMPTKTSQCHSGSRCDDPSSVTVHPSSITSPTHPSSIHQPSPSIHRPDTHPLTHHPSLIRHHPSIHHPSTHSSIVHTLTHSSNDSSIIYTLIHHHPINPSTQPPILSSIIYTLILCHPSIMHLHPSIHSFIHHHPINPLIHLSSYSPIHLSIHP